MKYLQFPKFQTQYYQIQLIRSKKKSYEIQKFNFNK